MWLAEGDNLTIVHLSLVAHDTSAMLGKCTHLCLSLNDCRVAQANSTYVERIEQKMLSWGQPSKPAARSHMPHPSKSVESSYAPPPLVDVLVTIASRNEIVCEHAETACWSCLGCQGRSADILHHRPAPTTITRDEVKPIWVHCLLGNVYTWLSPTQNIRAGTDVTFQDAERFVQ